MNDNFQRIIEMVREGNVEQAIGAYMRINPSVSKAEAEKAIKNIDAKYNTKGKKHVRRKRKSGSSQTTAQPRV